MALVPNPDGNGVNVIDDVTGATLSEGVPPDMLGSLYNPGAGAPPPTVPDLRTADAARGGGVQAASVGPTGTQTPVSAPGMGDIAKAFAPQITMGPASGAPAPAPAPAPQAAPATATPAPVDTAPGSSFAGPTEQALRTEALRLMQPRPGVAVNRPAKNVLQNFQVGVTPKLSPKSREELDLARELSFTRAARLAAEGGMLASASHEDEALNFERQRQEARSQLANIKMQERERDQMVGAHMRELDGLNEELRSKRKDARFGAEAYWEDKGTFGTIMAKIGMAMYAAGGAIGGFDPMGLAKEINAQAENYNAGKRVEIELLGQDIDDRRTALSEIRKQFISKDAAELATKSLMNEAMAAETQELAAHYKSAEAQNVALQLVNQLQAQAAEARAAAELAEKDAITQNWQHLEAMRGVVGGSRGLDVYQIAEKFFPGDPERVLKATRLIQEQKLDPSKSDMDIWKANKDKAGSAGNAALQKYHMQGLVQLPQGGYGWTPHGPDAASKAQAVLHVTPKIINNLKRIKTIVAGVATIDKLSPEDRGELETLAAANARLIKGTIGEALTATEYSELWSKISGGNMKDIWKLANEEKQLDTAISSAKQFADQEMGKLRKVPPGLDPGEPLVPPVPEEADDEPK